jgi:hypothetical protein
VSLRGDAREVVHGMRTRTVLITLALSLPVAGCGSWSWNPVKWFQKQPEPPPPVVEMLTIESPSTGGDSFSQSWDGARLIVDITSPGGSGKATLKPREQGWPLRLAFRMHVTALEGFEAHAAQNLRISLGSQPLTEPALVDLPYGIYTKDSSQLEIQWIDHYR